MQSSAPCGQRSSPEFPVPGAQMLLSELLGIPVVDEHGERVGVVHDVVAVQDGPIIGSFGAALRVEALVVGRRGFWARLGLSAAHVRGPAAIVRLTGLRGGTDEVPWRAGGGGYARH